MHAPLPDKARHVRRRSSYEEVKDDFPTPPWAVRAFFEHVAPDLHGKPYVFYEPAAGRGHMVRVLKEERFKVVASDLVDYGTGFKTHDFLTASPVRCDVVLTNPPYKHANAFVQKALKEARIGVAMLLRTIWLESATRYNTLFSIQPPSVVAVFSARMHAAQGKVVRSNGAMFSHAWFWWDKRKSTGRPALTWIPPAAQKQLECDADYE